MPATERPLLHYKDHISLKAPSGRVWNIIKDFDSIHTWHPLAEDTVLLVGENNQPLAVREFQTGDGGYVISELLEFDELNMRFKYRIIKTSAPIRDYVGEMHVAPKGDGSSTVYWSAKFRQPENIPQSGKEQAATMEVVKRIFKGGLNNLADMIQ